MSTSDLSAESLFSIETKVGPASFTATTLVPVDAGEVPPELIPLSLAIAYTLVPKFSFAVNLYTPAENLVAVHVSPVSLCSSVTTGASVVP